MNTSMITSWHMNTSLSMNTSINKSWSMNTHVNTSKLEYIYKYEESNTRPPDKPDTHVFKGYTKECIFDVNSQAPLSCQVKIENSLTVPYHIYYYYRKRFKNKSMMHPVCCQFFLGSIPLFDRL
jgi:hypothetical protein